MPTTSAAFLPLNDSTGEFEVSLTRSPTCIEAERIRRSPQPTCGGLVPDTSSTAGRPATQGPQHGDAASSTRTLMVTPAELRRCHEPGGYDAEGHRSTAHLVAAPGRRRSGGEVLGIHVVDELAELLDHLLRLLLVGLFDPAGLVEHVLLREDRRADADGERDGVGRAARHRAHLALGRQHDLREEGAV